MNVNVSTVAKQASFHTLLVVKCARMQSIKECNCFLRQKSKNSLINKLKFVSFQLVYSRFACFVHMTCEKK